MMGFKRITAVEQHPAHEYQLPAGTASLLPKESNV